jgi:hypothetical protein
MNNFEYYLEAVKENKNIVNKLDIVSELEIGKTYIFENKKVKYIGLKEDNREEKINASDDPKFFSKSIYLFKWLEGGGSISSHGVKGDIIALNKETVNKKIKTFI